MAAALILAAGGLALFLIRRMRFNSDARFSESLKRHNLEAFNASLKSEIASGNREITSLVLPRMMIDILDELERSAPERNQSAVVEPPDAGYRLACEELVKLGRLTRVRDGIYTPARAS